MKTTIDTNSMLTLMTISNPAAASVFGIKVTVSTSNETNVIAK